MKRSFLALSALAVLLFARTAAAHTGFSSTADFAEGAMHPLLGLDHTLAMLGVGLWAVLFKPGSRAIVWLPLLFMGGMAVGGWFGATGHAMPYLETAIAVSVVAVGIPILARYSGSLPTAGGWVVLFAWLHGYAHGRELADFADYAGYALGFSLSTGLLHLLGIAVGLALLRKPRFYRVCGGTIGAVGLALLAHSL